MCRYLQNDGYISVPGGESDLVQDHFCVLKE